MPAKSRKPSTETDAREELPDAWERFERAVDDAVKHGPTRRELTQTAAPRRAATNKEHKGHA